MNRKGLFIKLILLKPGEEMRICSFQIIKRTNENVELQNKTDTNEIIEISDGSNLDCADYWLKPPQVKILELAARVELKIYHAYFYEWDECIMLVKA